MFVDGEDESAKTFDSPKRCSTASWLIHPAISGKFLIIGTRWKIRFIVYNNIRHLMNAPSIFKIAAKTILSRFITEEIEWQGLIQDMINLNSARKFREFIHNWQFV